MSSLSRHVFFVCVYVSFYSHMFPSETMYWNFLQLFEKLPYPGHRSGVFFSRIAQLFIPSNAQYSRNLRHFGLKDFQNYNLVVQIFIKLPPSGSKVQGHQGRVEEKIQSQKLKCKTTFR